MYLKISEFGEETPLLVKMDDNDMKKSSVEVLVSNDSGKKFPQYLAAVSCK